MTATCSCLVTERIKWKKPLEMYCVFIQLFKTKQPHQKNQTNQEKNPQPVKKNQPTILMGPASRLPFK